MLWLKLIHVKRGFLESIDAESLKIGNGQLISSHTLLGIGLLIHAGIKVNPY